VPDEDSPGRSRAVAAAGRIFGSLQQRHIDPTLLTANARSYFTPPALADFRASLESLDPPESFVLLRTSWRGGLVTRACDVTCGHRQLRVIERSEPDGLVEQFTVSAR
jgi:hypothetical protein